MSLPPQIDATAAQMRRGLLELCVLEVIARGPVYTSDLIAELTDARLVVVEGTLYPMLTRLKNAGHLAYKWQESPSGPPRKYYMLTDEGRGILAQLRQAWAETRASVDELLAGGTRRPPTDEPPADPTVTPI